MSVLRIGSDRCMRWLGLSMLVMLVACGRPAEGAVTSTAPDATAIIPALPPTDTFPTAMVDTIATPPLDATTAAVMPPIEETIVPVQNAELVERARQQGTLRIVVNLAVPWKPEAELADQAAVLAQRKAIADAQNGLMNRLASYNVSGVTKFEFIPAMGMVVDAPALQVIAADPAVQSIQEDTPASPSLQAPAAPSLDAPN